MNESRCRSCGELILWARSAKTKKPLPLNPTPSETGNVEVRKGNYSEVYWCRVLTPEQQGERLLYEAHFVTCPHAKRHRKR